MAATAVPECKHSMLKAQQKEYQTLYSSEKMHSAANQGNPGKSYL